ncbi:TetR/AcrR family transcriptional regulator [Nocardia sp. NPDC004860]|uniref:TetR/AcrR family transcriptional regulator n=1 Tax=Nocardia sp. NPDC004860 TaxID=3154557 RepID=UPI00339FB2CE
MSDTGAARADKPQGSATPSRREEPAEKQNTDRVSVRRGLVEQQIYIQATRLFAERGFAGTSFQDIADAVGLTRPALYHYVSSKDDLLARIVTETTQDAAMTVQQIVRREDLDPAQKVREIVRTSVIKQGKHSARFQLLLRSEANLPEAVAETHLESRRIVLRSITALLEDGIASGIFRPADARVAALGVIGLTNWVAWWYSDDHGDDLVAISEELADLAVAGVVAEGGPHGPVGSPAEAIKTIRANLVRLEEMLDG